MSVSRKEQEEADELIRVCFRQSVIATTEAKKEETLNDVVSGINSVNSV